MARTNTSSGGSGGGLAIGEVISGGTPTEVLYTDNAGNLFSDSNFTRDSATQQTTILTDLALIPGSPLTNVSGLQSGLLFGGGLFGTAITVTDPADANKFSIIGASKGVTTISAFDFTSGELKQASQVGSLFDDNGNVSYKLQVSDELNSFFARLQVDLNGTIIENTTGVQLISPNLIIGSSEGASDNYSLPTSAGDEGKVLTAHGNGMAATWDEFLIIGTPYEATYYAADGALTSDPYFYRQGENGNSRIMVLKNASTVLTTLDVNEDGTTQIYSNDYISGNFSSVKVDESLGSTLSYTTDSIAFAGIKAEVNLTTLGTYEGGNGTRITINDNDEDIFFFTNGSVVTKVSNETYLNINGANSTIGDITGGYGGLGVLRFDVNSLNSYWGDEDNSGSGALVRLDRLNGTIETIAANQVSILSSGHVGLQAPSIKLNGGLDIISIANVNYGTTTSVDPAIYHYTVSTSSGAATIDLDQTYPVGHILVISDLGLNASVDNITIDAQTGNAIVSTGGSAQTFVINSNGESVTIQKVNSTTWMVI